MKYVVADIHGCYEEYMELIQKINLSEEDHLYILGDALDRGDEPMKVILDMEQRKNITYITVEGMWHCDFSICPEVKKDYFNAIIKACN